MRVAVLLLLCAASCDAATSDVLNLTTASFDDEVSKHTVLAVKFYAPWCKHCMSLLPVWEKVRFDFSEHDLTQDRM